MPQSPSTRLIYVLLGFCILLASCSQFEDDYHAARRARAQSNSTTAPIVIGVAWNFTDEYNAARVGECANLPVSECPVLPLGKYDMLPLGVHMAVEEINANGGVLGGRLLQIRERDDNESITQGRLVAQEFAEETDVVAVIGHAYSSISIPASPLYEFNGVIMLSPAATSPHLTHRGFTRVFRNLISDDQIGQVLADYAFAQGYRRVMIIYRDEAYGRDLSNVFETEAARLGVEVVDRRIYSSVDFERIIRDWAEQEFDAILIATSSAQDAALFIKRAGEAGINVPFLGGDGIDSSDIAAIAGEYAEGTVVATHYHQDNPRPQLQEFIQRFNARWGDLIPDYQSLWGGVPDTWAALGYDAVYILANAIEQAGITDPDQLAAYMHEDFVWLDGVTGAYRFDEKGDVVGKQVVLLRLEDGEFRYFGEFTGIDDITSPPTPEPEATTSPEEE